MRIRKAIGWILLTSPFMVIGIVGWASIGWSVLWPFAMAGAMIGVMWLGCELAFGDAP